MSNEIENQPRYEAEVAIKFGINPLCCEKESQINSFPYSFPSFCQTTINGEKGKTEPIFFLCYIPSENVSATFSSKTVDIR